MSHHLEFEKHSYISAHKNVVVVVVVVVVIIIIIIIIHGTTCMFLII
jgi:hypothetical protein